MMLAKISKGQSIWSAKRIKKEIGKYNEEILIEWGSENSKTISRKGKRRTSETNEEDEEFTLKVYWRAKRTTQGGK